MSTDTIIAWIIVPPLAVFAITVAGFNLRCLWCELRRVHCPSPIPILGTCAGLLGLVLCPTMKTLWLIPAALDLAPFVLAVFWRLEPPREGPVER